jgi:hypothetical protein
LLSSFIGLEWFAKVAEIEKTDNGNLAGAAD